ncbi:DUF58 domain-containing protein [bacterium]|nr:DUF58 domain-containing protein [bacterium]
MTTARSTRRGGRAGDGRPARDHLGRRVAGGACALAACAALPPFVSGPIGYVPLGMALAGALASYACLRVVDHGVRVTPQAHAQSCVRGEQARAALTLSNDAPLAASHVELLLRVSRRDDGRADGDVGDDGADDETSELRVRACLGPRGACELPLAATFDHVGTYDVSVDGEEVFDMTGLLSRVHGDGERCTVRCRPRVLRLEEAVGRSLTASDTPVSARTTLSDDRDYAFTREYEQGDPLKTVHWKLSARTDGQLLTRLYESHVNPGTTVALDLTCADADAHRRACVLDATLEAAFSALAFAHGAGIRTCLAFLDRSGAARRVPENDPERLYPLVDEIPAPRPAADDDAVADLLRQDALRADPGASLLFVCSEPAERTARELVEQHDARRGVTVLRVAVPGSRDDAAAAAFARIGRAGIPVLRIASADELAAAVHAASRGAAR